jgi:hypothetical protein
MQLMRAASVCMRIETAAAGTQHIALVAASIAVGIAVGKLSGLEDLAEGLEELLAVSA